MHLGFGHGVRRSLISLGCLFGSMWAGVALDPSKSSILLGVPLGLLILATVSNHALGKETPIFVTE